MGLAAAASASLTNTTRGEDVTQHATGAVQPDPLAGLQRPAKYAQDLGFADLGLRRLDASLGAHDQATGDV